MALSALRETAAALVTPGKGILAADESIATMSSRLETAGVPASVETRRAYRELLLTAPGLADSITGIILSDETLRQNLADGTAFPLACAQRGIQAGIKVDTGTTPLPFSDGGLITQGLDGLRGRLEDYHALGATFAKWRAVLPPVGLSPRTIHANSHALARYAALCKESGIVPIIEPEVLMDGDHGIATCETVTRHVLTDVFADLESMGVDLAAIVLKPNMIVAGLKDPHQPVADSVAIRTLTVLRETVPPSVPGIAFLSGGQSNLQACWNLTAINRQAADVGAAWHLTFSFGRALVNDALTTWRGEPGNLEAAQQALLVNCRRAGMAATRSARLPAEV